MAQDEVCILKKEDGLGIMKIKTWNKIVMAKHIQKIFNHNNSSVRIDQIKAYRLKGRNF